MTTMTSAYAPNEIEPKWQAYWEREHVFAVANPGDPAFDDRRPKFYVLDMFPYPSGAGLHVGHPEGYTATDIVARYRRMRGFNVLHPMGWDAFGLPAEQYAVDTGTHPRITTEKNIAMFRRQLKMLGFSYDWNREVATTDPDYYRWTQWIFLQLFNSWYDEAAGKARPISELAVPADVSAGGPKAEREFVDSRRLAYVAEVPVNWCPALGTVLANEEVTNEGRSDRGNHRVYRRPLRQWMLRITKYADRLEEDLSLLDWPESVKLMQRNWIGRSEGAQVRFPVNGTDDVIEVFTTRPDTLFGATYMVLAPEHPLVARITCIEQRDAVRAYCDAAARRSDLARTAETKEKTGVATGACAVNPVNGARIPIWVADYVLISYGTGAIMAVPAHDTRDFDFAKQFDLPIVAVVRPPDEWLHEQVGRVGFDRAYARRHDRGDTVETLMRSATAAAGTLAGVTGQDARATVDGDSGWIEQVCVPAYLADPGLFVEAYTGHGTAVHSGEFDGLSTAVFKKRIADWLDGRRLGRATVNYKLRDWLFSRQRYWGEPFPILHGPDGEVVGLDESELPLELPDIDDFRPSSMPDDSDAVPEPPLGRAKDWLRVERDGKVYTRELNTMPQWAGSCWYYLRFLDPKNGERFCAAPAEHYWMGGYRNVKTSKRQNVKTVTGAATGGIDLYLGGAEHAVLHLLYARFWHKVLFDLGHVSTPEPFAKLFNQGMIRAFAYRDERGTCVGYDEIDFREDGAYRTTDGCKLSGAIEKMSKSLKNVVNPDKVVSEYGADALRLYEMFMGPLDASKPWNPRDVPGVFRFLQRAWRLIVDENTGGLSTRVSNSKTDEALERALHKTIRKVTDDIERMAFNTAISAMMEFVNEAYRGKVLHREQAERFVLLLSPFAPHLAEELWQRLRGERWSGSLAYEPWPSYDETWIVDETIEVPVQVNGKLAGRVRLARDASEEAVLAAAMADEKVLQRIGGAAVVKRIYVPGRMLNLVVRK